ncbi:MAG: hypothetical protein ACR2QF_01240, partial [Geminicoccaceae bacterium]
NNIYGWFTDDRGSVKIGGRPLKALRTQSFRAHRPTRLLEWLLAGAFSEASASVAITGIRRTGFGIICEKAWAR